MTVRPNPCQKPADGCLRRVGVREYSSSAAPLTEESEHDCKGALPVRDPNVRRRSAPASPAVLAGFSNSLASAALVRKLCGNGDVLRAQDSSGSDLSRRSRRPSGVQAGIEPGMTADMNVTSILADRDNSRPHICIIDAHVTLARRNTCFREGGEPARWAPHPRVHRCGRMLSNSQSTRLKASFGAMVTSVLNRDGP